MSLDESEIIGIFIAESKEHLTAIQDDFLVLESNPENPSKEVVNRVFRALHTIKGSSGMLGLKIMFELSHQMENILGSIRNGEMIADTNVISVLLEGIDEINKILDLPDIMTSNNADVSELNTKLSKIQNNKKQNKSEQQKPEAANVSKEVNAEEKRILELQEIENILAAKAGDIIMVGEKTEKRPDAIPELNPPPLNNVSIQTSEFTPTPLANNEVKKNETAVNKGHETIRIRVNTLDQLMVLASELVLVRNQYLANLDSSDATSRNVAQRLDLVTSELQEKVMQMRLQPFSNIFGKFMRIVRDLGKQLKKDISLQMEGGEVELDNTILEALTDPLVHMIRNSCDHGIELPEQRVAAGKPPNGVLKIIATHEGGQICIKVQDDGKGIDPDKIRKSAISKKLLSENALLRMSDEEVINLVFMPGFSTATVVNDLSGRGVGMDVVKTSIEQLGGSVRVRSKVGKGNSVEMRLPLTLAIIPCLIVAVGSFRYAIPQLNVEGLVCLYDEDVRTKIEIANGFEVYRLRKKLLPVARMQEIIKRKELFGEQIKSEIAENYRQQLSKIHLLNPEESLDSEFDSNDEIKHEEFIRQALNLVVIKIGTDRFGLIVDKIIGTEEVVVTPMHPLLKNLEIYSGATIMGDGQVALILDVVGIAKHAGIEFESMEKLININNDELAESSGEKQALLLFKNGAEEQFAFPLSLIRRIEHIKPSQIEHIGRNKYVILDGRSVPMAYLHDYFDVSKAETKEEVFFIIPKKTKMPFGIVATHLIDVAEFMVKLDTNAYKAEGILGTDIIRNQITLFPDIEFIENNFENNIINKEGNTAHGNNIPA